MPRVPGVPHIRPSRLSRPSRNCPHQCSQSKVVAVEKKVRRRRDDIIAAVELGISNGRVEAINNKIKVTVRMGYGFRNTDNLVALLMLRCGDCQPQLPGRPVKARKKGVKGAKSVAA
ncbi:transposase [Collinsella sp. LCP19S3_B11]|uniref:transposase n=1 Tax=Collinsella sp. LCP19S3_B11 TaxID=3438754 RepID=UPI003F9371AC